LPQREYEQSDIAVLSAQGAMVCGCILIPAKHASLRSFVTAQKLANILENQYAPKPFKHTYWRKQILQ
jgi:hypothetical protein